MPERAVDARSFSIFAAVRSLNAAVNGLRRAFLSILAPPCSKRIAPGPLFANAFARSCGAQKSLQNKLPQSLPPACGKGLFFMTRANGKSGPAPILTRAPEQKRRT